MEANSRAKRYLVVSPGSPPRKISFNELHSGSLLVLFTVNGVFSPGADQLYARWSSLQNAFDPCDVRLFGVSAESHWSVSEWISRASSSGGPEARSCGSSGKKTPAFICDEVGRLCSLLELQAGTNGFAVLNKHFSLLYHCAQIPLLMLDCDHVKKVISALLRLEHDREYDRESEDVWPDLALRIADPLGLVLRSFPRRPIGNEAIKKIRDWRKRSSPSPSSSLQTNGCSSSSGRLSVFGDFAVALASAEVDTCQSMRETRRILDHLGVETVAPAGCETDFTDDETASSSGEEAVASYSPCWDPGSGKGAAPSSRPPWRRQVGTFNGFIPEAKAGNDDEDDEDYVLNRRGAGKEELRTQPQRLPDSYFVHPDCLRIDLGTDEEEDCGVDTGAQLWTSSSPPLKISA